METITVARVVAKDGNKPWKVFDGNGVEYATWDDTVGAAANALAGEQAKVNVKVTEKEGRGGVMFVNRLLESIEKIAPEPQKRDGQSYEPSVNFGKQVVIIRQNAWSQTNAIYEKAVELYKWAYPPLADRPTLDMQSLHAIAWQLYSSSKRPEASNMQTIASDIELVVRSHWFPLEGDEIPFLNEEALASDPEQAQLLDETMLGPSTPTSSDTPSDSVSESSSASS